MNQSVHRVLQNNASENMTQQTATEKELTNPETSGLGTSAMMKAYSHHGGLSERDLREMEDERTF